ncbi:hypothetical protein [Terracidiphilus gabretensis]|uniref:hypothetical protein n=1 Tax=Terracidiphilus gabretensis TaxID=1577687 RepID=UPI00071B3F70|nr:hypothetical protein [Terracidiphilus gabretensis]
MATPYEEMTEAAEVYKNRHRSGPMFVQRFVEKFVAYCEIPPAKIRFMRFDEDRGVFTIRGNEIIGFHQAIRYFEKFGQWRMGIRIMFGSDVYSVFGLHVADNGSTYFVRLGGPDEPYQAIDLNDEASTEAYFTTVAALVKNGFLSQPFVAELTPNKKASRIGFQPSIGANVDVAAEN